MLARFENLSYRYPEAYEPALSHVSLTIDEGEFIILTGPSGSGKSTLARCLNGIVPHFHGGAFDGKAIVGGFDTRGTSTAQLASLVALVSQDPERQSVAEMVAGEIAFGPENLGLSTAEIGLRVEESLALFGISTLRDRPLETLSGGERQLVAIAAAMAMRPQLLVLDEPTSQLDSQGSALVFSALGRINDELGTAILLIEHRLEGALPLANRIVALGNDGKVILNGSTSEVVRDLPELPVLALLARHFGWSPPPLTVRAARGLAARTEAVPHHRPAGEEHSIESLSEERPAPLICQRLSYGYDGKRILHQVDAAYPAGTITALLGVNGAGKTTLLKLLRGLLRPSGGRVLIDNQDIAKRSVQELAPVVGYLPQDPNRLLFNPTVEDELRFTLRCLRRDGDIGNTLEAVGLSGFESRNPLDLSGGERQRAALAAILVGQPRVLLLDEPTRGMSHAAKQPLGELLRQLARRGCTIVMATHDLELAAESADLIQVVGDRRSLVHASPEQVMPGSLSFSPIVNRVFGGSRLTLSDLGIIDGPNGASTTRSAGSDGANQLSAPEPATLLRPDA